MLSQVSNLQGLRSRRSGFLFYLRQDDEAFASIHLRDKVPSCPSTRAIHNGNATVFIQGKGDGSEFIDISTGP